MGSRMRRYLQTLIIIVFTASTSFALTPGQEQELFSNIGEIKGQLYQIDKRFDDVNERFEQLYTFLWVLCSIFTSLVAVVIGFAYWDRRTVLYQAKEETIHEIDEYDKEKTGKILDALRLTAKRGFRTCFISKAFRSFMKYSIISSV